MLFHERIDTIPMLLTGFASSSTATAPSPMPTLQVELQSMSPLVVGVDLGGTQIRTAIVRDGEIIARVNRMTPATEGPDSVIAAIKETVYQVLQSAQVGLNQIQGIGVAAPGPLNPRTGIVYEAPNLQGWIDIPLRDKLTGHFDKLPVVVGHDATLAALAEFTYGAGRSSLDMIYMTISTGIGGGIIADGKIIDGVIGTAGEVGHMYIDISPNAPRCGSGHAGCLEALSSGTALARDANDMLAEGRAQGIQAVYQEFQAQSPDVEATATDADESRPLQARDVMVAAHRGDPEAQLLIKRAANAIGIGCVNLIHTLNPQVIVLGGGVAQSSGTLLTGPIAEVIKERSFVQPGKAVDVVHAQLGGDVGLIGAAVYVDYVLKHGGHDPSHHGPTTV
jgi:glucokinase